MALGKFGYDIEINATSAYKQLNEFQLKLIKMSEEIQKQLELHPYLDITNIVKDLESMISTMGKKIQEGTATAFDTKAFTGFMQLYQNIGANLDTDKMKEFVGLFNELANSTKEFEALDMSKSGHFDLYGIDKNVRDISKAFQDAKKEVEDLKRENDFLRESLEMETSNGFSLEDQLDKTDKKISALRWKIGDLTNMFTGLYGTYTGPSGEGTGLAGGSLGLDPETLTSINALLNTISDNLQTIASAIGSVDKEKGFTPLINQLKNLRGQISETKRAISELDMNFNLNVGNNEESQKRDLKYNTFLEKQYNTWIDRYKNLFETAKKAGMESGEFLNGVGGIDSIYNLYGGSLANRFSYDTISGLDGFEEKIKRIIELFDVLKGLNTNSSDKFQNSLSNTIGKIQEQLKSAEGLDIDKTTKSLERFILTLQTKITNGESDRADRGIFGQLVNLYKNIGGDTGKAKLKESIALYDELSQRLNWKDLGSGGTDTDAALKNIQAIVSEIKKANEQVSGGIWDNEGLRKAIDSVPNTSNATQYLTKVKKDIYELRETGTEANDILSKIINGNIDNNNNSIELINKTVAELNQSISSLQEKFKENVASEQLQQIIEQLVKISDVMEKISALSDRFSTGEITIPTSNSSIETKLTESAQDTAKAVEQESKTAETASDNFEKMADSKKKATKSNKDLDESAKKTTESVKEESTSALSAAKGFEEYRKKAEQAYTSSANFSNMKNRHIGEGFKYDSASMVGYAKDTETAYVRIKYVNTELGKTIEEMYKLDTATGELEQTSEKWSDSEKQRQSQRQKQLKEEQDLLKKNAEISAKKAKTKNSSAKKSEAAQEKEVNTILNKQADAYKQIQEYKRKIASLDPQKDAKQIAVLKDGLDIARRTYVETQKELSAYNNLKLSAEHLNRLSKIRREEEEKIALNSAKQADKASSQIPLATNKGFVTSFTDMESAQKYYEGLGYSLDKISASGDKATLTLTEADGTINTIALSAGKAGEQIRMMSSTKPVSQLSKALKTAGGMFKQFAGYYLTVTRLVGYARQSISTLKEFDSAMTNISYTMNISSSTLDKFGDSVIEMAKNTNASVKNAQEVVAIYANMNTSTEEIQEMAKPALVLANLTGSAASSMADSIQAVSNAFEDMKDKSMHIADTMDYISQNIALDYSTGITDMTEAVQVAGATAEQAGLSFEQLSAIVGTTAETTRQAGSQIGNALKTIFVRLSKASKLDDTIDNETLSNASKALHEIGIEVYNLDGSYREFDVIIQELAEKWDGLSDAQRANISYNIAATRQSNMLSVVLKQWSRSMSLAEEATNNEGSALANNEKYMNSYAGKLQALSTASDSFWIHLLDDESFKIAISFFTGLIGAAEKLTTTIGSLPSIGGVLGLAVGVKSKSNILGSLLTSLNARESTNNISNILSGITQETINASSSFEEFAQTVGAFPKKYEPTIRAIYNGNIALGENQNALQAIKTQMGLTSKAAKAFKGVMLSLGSTLLWMAAGFVIGKIIEAATDAIDKAVNRVKYAKEAVEDIKAEIDQLQSSLKSIQKTVKNNGKTFAQLAQGVDLLTGKNKSLSTDEYEQFLDLSNQLAESFTDLPRIYTENGDAIVQLSGSVDTIVESLEKLVDVQRQLTNSELSANLNDLYNNISTQVFDLGGTQDEINKLKDEIDYYHQLDDAATESGKTIEEVADQVRNMIYQSEAKKIWAPGVGDVLSTLFPFLSPAANQIKTDSLVSEAKELSYLDNVLKGVKQNGSEFVSSLESEIATLQKEVNDQYSTLQSSITAWLYSSDNTQNWSDGMYSAVQGLFGDFDWSGIKLEEGQGLKDFLLQNLINPLNSDPEYQQALLSLYTPQSDSETAEEYLNRFMEASEKVQTYADEHGITVNFTVKQEDAERVARRFADELNGSQYLTDFFAENSINTEAELDEWQEVTKGIDGLIAKADAYLEWKKKNKSDLSFDDIFALEGTDGKKTPLGTVSEEIDKIQTAFSGLKDMMSTYQKTGKITVDQFQALLSYGDDYLGYLSDEEGNLKLDEEAIKKVAAAKIEKMRVEAISNLVNQVKNIQSEADAEKFLASKILETADATQTLARAELDAWYVAQMLENDNAEWVTETYNAVIDGINVINTLVGKMDLNSLYTGSNSSSGTDIVSAYMDKMALALDQGRIDADQYVTEVSAYLKDMWDSGKIEAKDYFDYIQQMYEKQESYLESVSSAAQNLLDSEIKKLNKVIDGIEKENDLLEKQATKMEKAASAVVKYYQDKVDAIEKENDALNDEKDNYDLILDGINFYYDDEIQALQDQKDAIQLKIDAINDEADAYDDLRKKSKALYDLEKAQSQKTKKIKHMSPFAVM